LANLAQHQTALLARISDLDAESSRRFRRIEKRLTRIEAILAEHSQILAQHSKILESLPERFAALPETIQRQFGFQPPKPPS